MHHAQGFTQIPNSIICNKDISLLELGLYNIVASYCYGNNPCFASLATMAKSTGHKNPRNLIKLLQSLERKGLIIGERQKGKATVYSVTTTPTAGVSTSTKFDTPTSTKFDTPTSTKFDTPTSTKFDTRIILKEEYKENNTRGVRPLSHTHTRTEKYPQSIEDVLAIAERAGRTITALQAEKYFCSRQAVGWYRGQSLIRNVTSDLCHWLQVFAEIETAQTSKLGITNREPSEYDGIF